MARRTLTEEERQKKRRLIMDSALKQFAENGYENASMSEIASLTGISTGALYLYFPGKAELYLALYDMALDALDHSFDDALNLPVPDIRTRLCMLFYSYINFFKSNNAMYRVLSDSFSGKIGIIKNKPELSEKTYAIIKRLEAPLIEGVLHGVVKPCNTFKTVITLWAMLDGILLLPNRMAIDGFTEQYQEFYAGSMDVMLNGILI